MTLPRFIQKCSTRHEAHRFINHHSLMNISISISNGGNMLSREKDLIFCKFLTLIVEEWRYSKDDVRSVAKRLDIKVSRVEKAINWLDRQNVVRFVEKSRAKAGAPRHMLEINKELAAIAIEKRRQKALRINESHSAGDMLFSIFCSTIRP